MIGEQKRMTYSPRTTLVCETEAILNVLAAAGS
jgi:hypothetical protein